MRNAGFPRVFSRFTQTDGLSWPPILVTKAMRFGFVGIVSWGIYAAITALCVSGLGFEAKLASIVGYLAALPFSFVAHRQYTFVASGAVSQQALRFTCINAANLAVSFGAVAAAVDELHLSYGFGVIAPLLLVPPVTLIVMNVWVFRDREGGWTGQSTEGRSRADT